MWDKVNTYVMKYQMIKKGDVILAGLSGGADSVCLLRYLLSVREKMGVKLYAVHVNHLLRGKEAERDQMFSGEFCEKWRIPFWAVKRNVAAESKNERRSLEEAGRIARYDCFEQAARRWGCNKIAVAHHKNDLAETMLFRMARGTGVRGMAGIRPVNGQIIRPLLCLEKTEILSILRRLDQKYVEDSTNMETDYSRNYIRRYILPEMEGLNSRFLSHMEQISQQILEIENYLEPIIQKLYQENVRWEERKNGGPGKSCRIAEDTFLQMHPLEQKEIAKKMLAEMSGQQRDISAVHVRQLVGMCGKKEGKYTEFPHGLTAKREGSDIVLFQGRGGEGEDLGEQDGRAARELPEVIVDKEILEKERKWMINLWDARLLCFRLEDYRGGSIEKNDCVKYFDYDKIKSTLCLRTRQSGDYFVIDKEGRHKSLKRYFIDEKIPAAKRGRMPLLADGNHVLWILGGRISEAYKVRRDTRRVLAVYMKDERG